MPGTTSASAERVEVGYYRESEPDRPSLARYGITVGDVREAIVTTFAGKALTTIVEGKARHTVNGRYPWASRSEGDRRAGWRADATGVRGWPGGATGARAVLAVRRGPSGIRTGNAQLVNDVYVDMHGRTSPRRSGSWPQR
jgi:copper/silver efflux system protein